MKESQIHDAFMVWLKKQGLFYIHSTFGKKATMTKDAPDFIILHCNRALMVECKTEKGVLTAGQKAAFAKLQSQSGMVVQIARSVEQAVSAVETWLGVAGTIPVPQLTPNNLLSEGAMKMKSTPVLRVGGANLFIGNIGGKDYVLDGDSRAGGFVTMVRTATAADLINIPRP